MDAATELFLREGYQRASMDEVAKRAAVSKQTVYKHFADKQRLFTEIVLHTLELASGPVLDEVAALPDTRDLPGDLRELARRYLATVMRPQVLALRRMIIGEAVRQPELAHAYYEGAPESTLATLADCFARLADRGLLRVPDPAVAAEQFAYLVLGKPLDKSLFYADDELFTRAELHAHADAAVNAFLAAYGAA